MGAYGPTDCSYAHIKLIKGYKHRELACAIKGGATHHQPLHTLLRGGGGLCV